MEILGVPWVSGYLRMQRMGQGDRPRSPLQIWRVVSFSIVLFNIFLGLTQSTIIKCVMQETTRTYFFFLKFTEYFNECSNNRITEHYEGNCAKQSQLKLNPSCVLLLWWITVSLCNTLSLCSPAFFWSLLEMNN